MVDQIDPVHVGSAAIYSDHTDEQLDDENKTNNNSYSDEEKSAFKGAIGGKKKHPK